jgi:hypothetical protein
LKTCSKCKALKEENQFIFIKPAQRLGSWCRTCRSIATKNYSILHKSELKIKRNRYNAEHRELCRALGRKFSATPKGKFSIYRRTAKFRNIGFEINYEDFLKFFNKDCYYCGIKIDGVGLDRIDNTKGYTLDNIVPCCNPCNVAKLTYTAEEYVERCIKVAERHGVKNV